MRPIAPLLAVPIIIGLIAGIAGLGTDFIKLLISLLKIGEWVLGILIVLKIIGWFIPSEPPAPSKPQLLHPQRDTPLEQGWTENYGKTKILHADGYAFQIANIGGRLHWREVDPQNKQPLEKWISAHPRHASYLGEDRIAREHITMRVNERKGL